MKISTNLEKLTEQTETAFRRILAICRELFDKKNSDYGTSWRILRPSSVTDQLYIKAKRIRNLQEKEIQKVADSIESEFIGIINYSLIALMQLRLPVTDENYELGETESGRLRDQLIEENFELLGLKNHDYDEAWRLMRVSGITDIILMKLLRIRKIEANKGRTEVSEGVESGYRDILNYAVFALILSGFGTPAQN